MPDRFVFYNGVAHALDRECSKYEAIEVQGSNIAGMGRNSDFQSVARRIDLGGAHVFPGFIDAHAHVFGMGERLTKPRLEGAGSKMEVYSIVKPLVHGTSWVVARGWNQNAWEEKRFPSRDDLDRNVSSEVPIALTRIDGHALWVNSVALRLAGITAHTQSPLGGSIERDSAGEPTGILIDEAMKLVEARIPQDASVVMAHTLRTGLEYFAKRGHAAVHEMGLSREQWETYRQVYTSHGDRLIRAYVFLDMTKKTGKELFLEMCEGVSADSPHSRLTLVGIKLYLDGALGSRGAELFEDYSDDPGNHGLALMEDEEVISLMKLAAGKGMQIAVHAIGDKANARALRLFEESGVSNSNALLRIEHSQIIRDAEITEFQRLGVFALVQPEFYRSDRRWALERLGGARMRSAYRWRSLVSAGIPFVAGSDAPIEEPDPLAAIGLLQQRDGVADGESLDFDTAIRSYAQSAYPLSPGSNPGGILEKGMRADMTVVMPGFNGRIDGPGAEIIAVVVDGEMIWTKPDGPLMAF